MLKSILIVDDEESIRINLRKYYKAKGYSVVTAEDGTSALETFRNNLVGLVLLDLKLPDMTGLEVLEKIKTDSPGTAVIIITAYGDVETAVQAMRMKADNFLLKPIDLTTLGMVTERILGNYRAQMEVQYLKNKVSRIGGMESQKKFRQPEGVQHAILLLANNPFTNVLILGETGTGKGMASSMIHELSSRKNNPFVDINCAGLKDDLLESELFGHEAGAFTDARIRKKGLLEVADGGSLFLDEIAEISLPAQAKLLKVIEDKRFRRLGGTANIEVDVRIMAASNIDLEQAVKEGRFRKDLFFRLNVMPITLPPLRNRREDILFLARVFLEEYCQLFGKKISGLSPESESMLIYYSWPGNIRELRNVVERAAILCDGGVVQALHLPENMRSHKVPAAAVQGEDWTLETVEKRHIEMVLSECKNNHSRAAARLGIHRSTLINKIKEYNLE
ncbi:MAG: sigma-54 dependent transcriptional regulator [bacterium]|nr:sigma-54 dependent transcriptional regulator [bacterium]